MTVSSVRPLSVGTVRANQTTQPAPSPEQPPDQEDCICGQQVENLKRRHRWTLAGTSAGIGLGAFAGGAHGLGAAVAGAAVGATAGMAVGALASRAISSVMRVDDEARLSSYLQVSMGVIGATAGAFVAMTSEGPAVAVGLAAAGGWGGMRLAGQFSDRLTA